ncbi:hypothetical protein OAT71_00485 [Flavobacteriales bacterium]|nr:hypothetical protein [Flavobacteriales bacterium]
MEINKETYEIWMIDYFDGNLDSEQVSELRSFLLTHPELECSIEDNLDVLDTPIEFSLNKESMEKSISYYNFESLAIDNIEGNLRSEEKIKYNELIDNDAVLAKHDQLFKNTKLPPSHIEYPNKEALIKTKIVTFNYKRLVAISSIAASLLIGIMVFNLEEKPTEQYHADKGNKVLNIQEDNAPMFKFKESTQQLVIVKNQNTLPIPSIATIEESSKSITPTVKRKEAVQVKHLSGLSLNSEDKINLEIPSLAIVPSVPANNRISTIIQDKIDKEVPENWKAMNLVEKLAFTVNRIGKEANTNISLKTEKDNTGQVIDWAFSLGKITISH